MLQEGTSCFQEGKSCFQEGKPCFQKGESCFQKGIHRDSLELIVLTWLHLDSLETMCFAGVLRTSGTNGTGEQAWQTTRKSWKTTTNNIRTHQEWPEHIQEAPQRLHDLAEQLSIPFRDTSQAPKPRARARGTVSL